MNRTWISHWAVAFALCISYIAAYSVRLDPGAEDNGDCDPCWYGHDCSIKGDSSPYFRPSDVKIQLADSTKAGQVIFNATAEDEDEDHCPYDDRNECNCSAISYSIVTGNDMSFFEIDPQSGELTLKTPLPPTPHEVFTLQIAASDGDNNFGTMLLTLKTGMPGILDSAEPRFMPGMPGSGDVNDGMPNIRHERSTFTAPATAQFNLVKEGVNSNVNEMRVGTRIQFKLEIIFPSGDTDMQIELFAPDTDNTIMIICNVASVKGSNLNIGKSVDPELDSKDNSHLYDHAMFDLGTVTNSESDMTSATPSTLVIRYDAIMVENAQTINDKEYWISAGAEFNSKNDVWVGQANFKALTEDDSASFSTPPKFEFTGPSTLEIGSAAKYQLEIFVLKPITDIALDVFASVNKTDVMSICNGKLVSVSDGYSCTIGNLWSYKPTFHADGNTIGHGRLHMNIGRLVNKLAREVTDINQHKLTFEVFIKMDNNETLVNNDFWLGASVEIGSTKLWAGQLKVTAIAPSSNANPPPPTLSTTFIGNDKISDTTPVLFKLDITIPSSSSADYVLEILIPYNDSRSMFQACQIKVLSVGDNLGCVYEESMEPLFIKSNESATIPDKISLNLGTITHVGTWSGGVDPGLTGQDVLSLGIYMKGAGHPLATEGSTHNVVVGVYVGETRLAVGKVVMTVGAAEAASEITGESAPDFTMTYLRDSDRAVIGETVKYVLDVTTKRNTTYIPMNMEFVMPNSSGSPMARICNVELLTSGKNTPCVSGAVVESYLKIVSSFEDGNLDRALLNLPSVCNMDNSNDGDQDKFKVAISTSLLEHDEHASNNKMWLSAGVIYSPSNMWVGQLALYADVGGALTDVTSQPLLSSTPFNSSITHIRRGYSTKHLIRIKMAPNDTSHLKIGATAKDNAVSVCSIRFVRAGSAYPCAKGSAGSAKSVVSSLDNATGLNGQVDLDLGIISNVGSKSVVASTDFDENTVELELVTKMTISPDAIDNSEHKVDLILKYDTAETTLTSTVTLTTAPDSNDVLDTVAVSVNVTGEIGSISGTNATHDNEDLTTIVPGESKRVLIYIDTESTKTRQFKVKLSTPTSKADIMNVDYIGVFEAGANLPCVNSKQTMITYSPRTPGQDRKDHGELDLFFVCNTGMDTENAEANRLTLEGVIRLDRNADVTKGDKLDFTVTVTSDDQQMDIIQLSLVVGDAADFVDAFQMNKTANAVDGIVLNETTPITMSIGEIRTFKVFFTIPAFLTARIAGDIKTAVNTSAILTLNEFKVVSSGANLPDMVKFVDDYNFKRTSTHNTSQYTRVDLDLGVLSNAGMTHRSPDYKKEDDTFSAELTLQMADHELAVHDSEQKVSFGLDVAKFIFIMDIMIKVSRTGSEELRFNISSAVDDVNSTSTRIEIDTVLKHDDTSTREGRNTILNLFLPPYVSHTNTFITSPNKEIEKIEKDGNAITITFGHFFFTDDIRLTTIISANSTFQVPPGVSGSDSIFQYQVIADTDNQYNLTSDLDYVNFTTTTTSQSGGSCTPQALGMQSASIKDCQLSASRDSVSDFLQGRHTSGSGWSPFVHPGKVREERYYQVFFGHKTLVNQVTIQQSGPAKATKVTIRHSNDGIAWMENSKNEIAVDQSKPEEDLAVPDPISSRYIRVMITDTTDNTQAGSYNFEFTGCATSNDGPADLCSGYKEPTTMPEFHSRSFLLADTTLFICDGRKKGLSIEQICYSTTDGNTWLELDKRVGSMFGYDSEEPRIYGLSTDGRHYMSSKDGNVWETSVPADVTNVKTALTFKSAKKVPLSADNNLKLANPHADYQDGIYGATITGIKKLDGAWQDILKWDECC